MDTMTKVAIGAVGVVAVVLFATVGKTAPKSGGKDNSVNVSILQYQQQMAVTAATYAANRDDATSRTTIAALQTWAAMIQGQQAAAVARIQNASSIATSREAAITAEKIAAIQASTAETQAKYAARSADNASNSQMVGSIGDFIKGGGISSVAKGVGDIISLF